MDARIAIELKRHHASFARHPRIPFQHLPDVDPESMLISAVFSGISYVDHQSIRAQIGFRSGFARVNPGLYRAPFSKVLYTSLFWQTDDFKRGRYCVFTGRSTLKWANLHVGNYSRFKRARCGSKRIIWGSNLSPFGNRSSIYPVNSTRFVILSILG